MWEGTWVRKVRPDFDSRFGGNRSHWSRCHALRRVENFAGSGWQIDARRAVSSQTARRQLSCPVNARRLYVSNIPFRYRERDLFRLMQVYIYALYCPHQRPRFPNDSILTLMTVWRRRGKIIRTAITVSYICTLRILTVLTVLGLSCF